MYIEMENGRYQINFVHADEEYNEPRQIQPRPASPAMRRRLRRKPPSFAHQFPEQDYDNEDFTMNVSTVPDESGESACCQDDNVASVADVLSQQLLVACVQTPDAVDAETAVIANEPSGEQSYPFAITPPGSPGS